MKKEVEILVEIFDLKEKVLLKLNNFKSEGTKETKDIYFFDPLRLDLKPDKTGQLKKCLRVRQKAAETSLTFKNDNFDEKGIWLYSDEYETKVSDLKVTTDLFLQLGFKELIQIDTKKHTFSNESYEIVLEEVKDLGLFMEVERLVVDDTEDILEIKQEILKFIQSLNIKFGAELTMGKPELMLRKKGVGVA